MSAASVLLVDDDRLLLELYATGLRQRGFTVHRASDTASARAIAAQANPRLACVDGRLALDSGADLAAELSAMGIAVVLFTNDQQLFDHPPAGVAARLIKANTSPRALAATLERILGLLPAAK